MINYLVVPGLGGSGEKHWQTWFEKTQPNFKRIEQRNWNEPDIDEWVRTVDKALTEYDNESVVLVAHSLGCLTVSEWVRRYGKNVKGAMLVAPPDIRVVDTELQRRLFTNDPIAALDFPSIVVASTSDQWSSVENARKYADIWGSRFINIGNAGHINVASGHYEWVEGLKILYSL